MDKMRFIWDNIPVFLIWLVGVSVLNNALHHVVPPVQELCLLSVFPLITFLILFWYAFKRDIHPFTIRTYLIWAVVMTGFYYTPLLHQLSMPLDLETQRLIYEFSALAEFIIIVFHSRTWLTRWGMVWIFGVTLFFGLILENGGIMMGFFQEEGYLLYIPGLPAPLATALGWVNVMYCAFFAVERLLPHMNPVLRGLICAVIGLSLDIPFDPVATRLGWWVWNTSLDKTIWGVPVINFVSWFWAIFPYMMVYYWIREKKNVTEGSKVVGLLGLVPAVLLLEVCSVVVTLLVIGDEAALMVFRNFCKSFFFQ